jgi:hypothetical protein
MDSIKRRKKIEDGISKKKGKGKKGLDRVGQH